MKKFIFLCSITTLCIASNKEDAKPCPFIIPGAGAEADQLLRSFGLALARNSHAAAAAAAPCDDTVEQELAKPEGYWRALRIIQKSMKRRSKRNRRRERKKMQGIEKAFGRLGIDKK